MTFFSLRRLSICLCLLTLASMPAALQAGPEKERTISFYHIHTKETLSITYKRDGKYSPAAMKKIDWFMRDWRQNTVVKIDPRTIDILWEMHTELGSKKPINIICGYRSRKTNRMLRRKRGGQASNSLHIYGKAIDAHFPDVPVRYVRYAALVRQRGGVGYYPTSALPFVHVDTGRVRHWPRMKRDELALLFSNGRSKHVPRGGRKIRPSDVARAKKRQKTLATKVAAYHTLRTTPKRPIMIADSGIIKPPKPALAERPQSRAPAVIARAPQRPATPQNAQTPTRISEAATTKPWTVEVEPNRRVALASPSPSSRPSVVFEPRPSATDRAQLDRLIANVTFMPLVDPPKLLRAATPATPTRGRAEAHDPAPAAAGVGGEQAPDVFVSASPAEPEINRFDWGADRVAVVDNRVWVSAPEYDDDHPDEMAYRPFPIEPLLTADPDNKTLTRLTKPDNAATLEMLAEAETIPPMRLRPPQQLAQLMWQQEFSGRAVQMHDDAREIGQDRLAPRRVATSTE